MPGRTNFLLLDSFSVCSVRQNKLEGMEAGKDATFLEN
jgi:hypothetical protein